MQLDRITFDSDDLAKMSYAAPVLLKMLQKREQSVLGRMHSTYCAGDLVQTQNLAEFRILRDMLNEINSALRAYDKKEK